MLTSVPAFVRMDVVHADLIGALVGAHKPASILELGFGSGIVTDAILRALYKGFPAIALPTYRVVDNWQDWSTGKPEAELREAYGPYPDIEFVTVESERAFIAATLTDPVTRYDFIVSDADHHHAHEWFYDVYERILTPGGILIYHDVSRGYGGLASIVTECADQNLRHVVFNRNALPSEACDRGLLVIFKP